MNYLIFQYNFRMFCWCFFERWQETALLDFLAMDFVCRQKPNVLFVRLGKLAENGLQLAAGAGKKAKSFDSEPTRAKAVFKL